MSRKGNYTNVLNEAGTFTEAQFDAIKLDKKKALKAAIKKLHNYHYQARLLNKQYSKKPAKGIDQLLIMVMRYSAVAAQMNKALLDIKIIASQPIPKHTL